MFRRLQVRRDRLGGLPRRKRRRERRRLRQQLVDRGRFVSLLAEAVSLGERRHLVGVDPVDQPVEMLPQTSIGPRTVRRLEQHLDRGIERFPRFVEVPGLQLPLAGLEMTS